MQPDAQPPARTALPRDLPLGSGEAAGTIAASRHLDAPVVGSHVDLFLGPADAAALDRDARVARTFRLPPGSFVSGSPVPGTYDAVELEPHRAEYLTLESPRQLSGGRGRVEPLLRAPGRAAVRADGFEARWAGWTVHGTRVESERWQVVFSPISPS